MDTAPLVAGVSSLPARDPFREGEALLCVNPTGMLGEGMVYAAAEDEKIAIGMISVWLTPHHTGQYDSNRFERDSKVKTATLYAVQRVAPTELFPGERKEYPVLTGLLMYFPDACAAVARGSLLNNEQHNPGEPMHWAKEKSVGDGNEIARHLMQGGSLDSDGVRHSVKMAWRALEFLQREIERERAAL